MTDHLVQSDLTLDADALLARRLEVLRELTEIGMEVARGLRAEAQALAAGAPGARTSADLTLTFARVSRAVRQTLALEARFVQDHQAGAEVARREAKAARQRDAEAEVRRRRGVVMHVVETALVGDEEPDDEQEERLYEIFDERLADERDLMDRPLSAIIAGIATALGVTVDWSLWADEDWAQDEARRRPPGSPYAVGVTSPERPGRLDASADPPEPGAIHRRWPGLDPGFPPSP